MEHEQLLQLIHTVSSSSLTEFHYEEQHTKLHLKKATKEASSTSQVISDLPSLKPSSSIVSSPLVGTFYAAPAEDAPPYVQVGDTVKKGQTLAIVEAMKLMNEIESDFDGVITEIHIDNGQSVEYGQPLFSIQEGSTL